MYVFSNQKMEPLSNLAFAQLPLEAINLLHRVSASPRLLAHMVLVHDAALKICEWLRVSFPELSFDRDAVLFGAATHDIGKAAIPFELGQPGSEHETRGFEMLRAMGVPEERARFAQTHGNWQSSTAIEDLLVALADKCWKGKRVSNLEDEVVRHLSIASGKSEWQCFSELDEFLTVLSADADRRLAWQRSFSHRDDT